MSGSKNRVELVGNVGSDPEIRRTQDGRPIASFRLATSESWTDKATGQKREQTEWHSVVVFSEGLVTVVEKYVRKGSKLCVEGKLKTRKWQDREGRDRWTTEVVLQGFDALPLLLSDARTKPSEDSYGAAPPDDDRPATTRPTSFANELDDDIPF